MGCASSKGNGPILADPPKWTSETKMTREELKKKREEFWETEPYYGGRPECWAALRQAVEAKDRKSANAIIVGAEMTLPTGVLTESYDALGYKYDIPIYCLREPINLA
eukprot:c21682_g1_i1.p2 GENE.c21682_g1_i1~~c21682_g1_i1.p2  ORF type:complete len:108 (+),score=17.26 c21682_g1_i1:107-430(+)